MYEDPASSHKGKTLDSAAAKWPEMASLPSMNERLLARMGREKSGRQLSTPREKYLFKTHHVKASSKNFDDKR